MDQSIRLRRPDEPAEEVEGSYATGGIVPGDLSIVGHTLIGHCRPLGASAARIHQHERIISSAKNAEMLRLLCNATKTFVELRKQEEADHGNR